MTWLRDLVAHLTHSTDQRADVADERARRQWRKVRDADRVIRAYRELDVVLKLHARHK